MKVYYQTDGFSTCYVSSIRSLKDMVELEIEEYFFDNDKITEREKDKIYTNMVDKVKKDKTARFNGFTFGTIEMEEEEFNKLEEFMGW